MLDLVFPCTLVVHHVWSLLAVTALLAGWLCLDESAAVQTWLSQPLPAAVLTGLVWGQPGIGLAIGFPLQMVLIGNFPVGQSFVGDSVTAVVGITAAACAAGLDGLILSPGVSTPQLGLWGWLLLGAGILSLGGHWLVRAERMAFGVWMHDGRKSLRDGSLERMEYLHLRCMMVTFLRGATFSIVYLILIRDAWIPLYPRLSLSLQQGLGFLPYLLPGVGVGALVEQFGWKRCWRWGALGVVLALLVGGGLWS